MNDPFLLVILSGIIISFLSAISIFLDKASRMEKLGTFLLFFSIGMKQTSYFLWYSGLEEHYLFFASADLPFVCCIGPLLFLYLHRIIDSKLSPKKTLYLPFLPALLSLFIIIPFMFVPDDEKKIIINELNRGLQGVGYAFFILAIRMVIFIQTTIYLIYFMAKTSILVSLKSFTRERITFHLFIIIILTISIVLLGLIAQIFFTFEQLKLAHQVMSILITGLLIYLHLLVRKFPHSASDVHIEYQKVKYENSNLRNVDLDQIRIKLTYLLEVEKVYADNELSLDKLATQLEIGSHKLSQYINEIMKSTFYDLINHYRLLASESLLLKNPDRTVLSIALEVGFSSQSTFYSAFGKKWKMSPNAYRKTYGLQDQKATRPDTRMSN